MTKQDDRDELKAAPTEGAAAPVGSLPVTWSNGQQRVAGKRALVMAPTPQETAKFSSPRARTCAECKNFDLQAGQRAMAKQRFLGALVHEHNWKVDHLGAPPETMGFCGQSGSTTLTSMYASACKYFAESRNAVRTK